MRHLSVHTYCLVAVKHSLRNCKYMKMVASNTNEVKTEEEVLVWGKFVVT